MPVDDGFDAAVDAVVDRLPNDVPLVLLGYSMGARIGLGIALRHPERVVGAVLVGVDPGIEDAVARQERAAWDDAQADALEAQGLDAFVRSWERLPIFEGQARLDAEVLRAQRSQRLENTASGLAWAMRTLGLGRMHPWWDALRVARVPLYVVTGARDTKFAATTRAMSAASDLVTHSLLPGAGHNPLLETPGALAAGIDSFLQTLVSTTNDEGDAVPWAT
jgi:2-succinyl-6-hydroxy-2,4-cyclohexadiene-1-carboxylate synthase